MMSTAKPLTERVSADQDRAADDSERVPTHGKDWLFLILGAGIAAILAIGTSLVITFAGNRSWAYVTSAACAVVAFSLLFVGFLRLRGSIRDAIAGSFLLGYLWLLSQLLFLPGLRDGLLQNPSGQLVFQQFTVIVGIVLAFYFVASGAVNVAAKLANARSKDTSEGESKYDALKPLGLGEREYLARREAAKQS
jgi:putative flippase GtrA